jgi:dTDP-4-amino-4,6-dideoxygalactose transaminase
MALKALDITKEVITTPFSYVATTNAILWENCTPIFVDIEPNTFCINPDEIEKRITPNTQAILATHVFGYPCNTDKIEAIAKKHNLKVIYDGAHAFGAIHQNKSLLDYGDISTCSFHATKLFHTVEGGCIITNNDEIARKIYLYRQFGHTFDNYFSVGINGKNSEFHAAMGLCVLPKINEIIENRKQSCELYNRLLLDTIKKPATNVIKDFSKNYAYYPVLFKNEETLLLVKETLQKEDINTRRYFYPSLNTLPFLTNYQPCSISEEISKRVLCLPLYHGLEYLNIEKICTCINKII